MQVLCVLERIVCGDPHQLFTFFLVLLHSRMLSRLCRIPLLRENLCCARLSVSSLGVLNAALRQPSRFFRPQQCAYAMARQRVCLVGSDAKGVETCLGGRVCLPASKRRAEIRCSVWTSGDAGWLSMAVALPHSANIRSLVYLENDRTEPFLVNANKKFVNDSREKWKPTNSVWKTCGNMGYVRS